MTVNQISIFLENKYGKLSEILMGKQVRQVV